MEIDNSIQQQAPLQTSTQEQSFKDKVLNQKGNFIIILGVILVTFVIGIGGYFLMQKNNKDSKTPVNQQNVDQPTQQINTSKKIMFVKNGKLQFCVADCRNPAEISTIDVKNSESFILSSDNTKLYFVKSNNLWTSNSDGSEVKQITNNNYSDNELQIFLLGVSKDNNKIFFSYELPVGMGDFKKNPALKYGVYYYDFSSQKLNFIKEIPIKQGESYDFVQVVNNAPVYAQIFDGYYYQLDLQSENFTKFTDKQFPAISNKAFINSNLGIIIYQAGYSDSGWQVWRDNSVPNSYSQILLIDYKNNKKIEVSPKGMWAQYQRLIVSPNYKTVVYSDEPKRLYYSYDITTENTTTLNISNYIFLPIWLDDDSFLYLDSNGSKPGTVYKYNLRNNSQEVLIDNVDVLIN